MLHSSAPIFVPKGLSHYSLPSTPSSLDSQHSMKQEEDEDMLLDLGFSASPDLFSDEDDEFPMRCRWFNEDEEADAMFERHCDLVLIRKLFPESFDPDFKLEGMNYK
jgi:hypothetical protein